MKNTRLKAGNFYRFKESDGGEHVGQYMGRQNGFECCVCGKGCNARTFNIFYTVGGWETWGFGNEHMPEILEDLGASETAIIDN